MSHALLDLVAARHGHFRMESGYHSDQWFELDRLFVDLPQLRPHVEALAQRLASYHVAAVCGPQTGGAHLAALLARALHTQALFTERHENPSATGLFPVSYRLPSHLRDSVRDQTIAVVDDAISAGSAIRGTLADLRACGARPVVLGALIVFGNKAQTYAANQHLPLECLVSTPFHLWPPDACPLCAQNLPLENISDAPATSPQR